MPKESQPTQQFVDIEEIRDGVIILKSGALRKVLMVSGINFELKSEEEQGIILGAYQNFLNSLDFSLQIIIHSRKLNINNYLDNLLDKKLTEKNELLKEQIQEYVEFIKSFVDTNEIMSKTFLAVVPYEKFVISSGAKNILSNIPFLGKKKDSFKSESQNLEENIIQLNQRADEVISGLSYIGLRAVALNNEELIELFYNLYNPDVMEKKKLALTNK